MFTEEAIMTKTEDTVMAAAQKTLPAYRLRYDALLVFITMIWGSTFLVVKYVVKLSGPFTYLAFAYGLGTLALTLIFRKRLARITRAELRNGLIIGMFLFTGYALQTTGLQFTTVSKAGFITGLNVPLIPVFMLLFLRQKLRVEQLQVSYCPSPDCFCSRSITSSRCRSALGSYSFSGQRLPSPCML
jgi:hypothetical protein